MLNVKIGAIWRYKPPINRASSGTANLALHLLPMKAIRTMEPLIISKFEHLKRLNSNHLTLGSYTFRNVNKEICMKKDKLYRQIRLLTENF